MRYRLTRSTQSKRAQFMTPMRLANRLMDFLPGNGESWLELGSGTGRLAQACLKSCKPSEFVGLELDRRLLANSPTDPRAQFHGVDVLSPSALTDLLGSRQFSRTIGNPPYGIQAMTLECQERLAALCPGIPQIKDWVQLDLYFVLESLSRLSRPGEAAFIVGAPIAEDERLSVFRRVLVAVASEVECFELPYDVFDKKAEVRSYLLVARFGTSQLKRVRVGKMVGANLDVVAERWITAEKAGSRLDFGYYEFEALNESLLQSPGCQTLRQLGASVIRGSRTRSEFNELGIACFHTSDFPFDRSEIRFDLGLDHGYQVACTGDVLLPRVGTRCLDRQALVASGQRHFTEAVLRIRAPKRTHTKIVDWVLGDIGTQWRQAAAKGSCAKHVTVGTMLNMPVPERGGRF